VNLATLRQEITSALEGINGLQVTAYPPGLVVAPHAFINALEVSYEHDSPDGTSVGVEVILVLGRSDEESSWDALDDFLTPGDPRCIRDALDNIDAVTDLDYVHCAAVSVESDITFGGGTETYTGARFAVTVVG
jgi:hypothetical protein